MASTQLLNLAEECTHLGAASQLVPSEAQTQGNGLAGLTKFTLHVVFKFADRVEVAFLVLLQD